MPINSFLLPGAKFIPGYEVANSCRFDDGSSSKLSKSISSSGNRKTWTWSAWIKRGNIAGANMDLFGTQYTGLAKGGLYIDTSERLYYSQYEAGGASNNVGIRTTRVFRDPSAWFHVCLIWDTTDSTGDDRIRLYINGTRETSLSLNTNPSLNLDGVLNLNTHDLFVGGEASSLFFDGYMSEVVFVDGQALTPDNFGEFDSDTPSVFKPIDVSGLTFGTNGFYLDFEDSSNLGNDVNGGTDFTESNLAATDQASDSPTNNFATMNPLDNYYAASTFSEGNLQVLTHSGNFSYNISTIGVPAGKWYCEIKCTAQSSDENKFKVGIAGKPTASTSDFLGEDTDTDDTIAYNGTDGDYQKAGTEVSYGDSYTTNDIIGIALDVDNSKLYFSKNGTFQNSGDPTSGATGTGAISTGSPSTGFWHFAVGDIDNDTTYTYQINFGNPVHSISSGNSDANGYGNFEYAVPSGYYALNTKNLAKYGG